MRRRLTGEKRGKFVLEGSNFFTRPIEVTEEAWTNDTAILTEEHARLRVAITQLPPALRNDPKKWRAAVHMIRGAAAHDVYHAGQIRLLRRMCPI